MTRRYMVVGNWKLNGQSDTNQHLLQELLPLLPQTDAVEVGVCPPYPYLDSLGQGLAGSSVALGAQNVSVEATGAYTGEVAATMLADVGCSLVIVGHSERRALYGDSDALVAQRSQQALAAGLCPIVCVGESLEEREAGSTLAVVERQLQAVLDGLEPQQLAQIVVAYEPVWAIGTGRTASPEQAQEVHAHLRGLLVLANAAAAQQVRILYGGSVKADNAADLFAQADIDGALVGGASLVAADFAAIVQAASS